MCDKNYEYFTMNFDELHLKYVNKFIVIKECKVIGDYESFDEAYQNTIKTEEIGTFLIQQCVSLDSTANFFYSNNVVFA